MKKWQARFFINGRMVEKVILAESTYYAQRQIQMEYPQATNISVWEVH